MQERQTSFYSDGYRLDASWFLPDAAHERLDTPLLIICSGFMGLKNIHPARFARFFTKYGYPCFGFDYRGFGRSEGTRGHVLLEEQVEDIANASLYAWAEMPKRKAVLIGWGMAGGLILEASHILPRMHGLMALNGFYNGKRVQEHVRGEKKWKAFQEEIYKKRAEITRTGECHMEPFAVYPLDVVTKKYVDTELRKNPDFGGPVTLCMLNSLMRFRPEAHLDGLLHIPLFIAHGTKNRIHPPEEAERLHTMYPGKKALYWIEGAGHTEWMHDDNAILHALIGEMHAWLKNLT